MTTDYSIGEAVTIKGIIKSIKIDENGVKYEVNIPVGRIDEYPQSLYLTEKALNYFYKVDAAEEIVERAKSIKEKTEHMMEKIDGN